MIERTDLFAWCCRPPRGALRPWQDLLSTGWEGNLSVNPVNRERHPVGEGRSDTLWQCTGSLPPVAFVVCHKCFISAFASGQTRREGWIKYSCLITPLHHSLRHMTQRESANIICLPLTSDSIRKYYDVYHMFEGSNCLFLVIHYYYIITSIHI